MLATTRYSRLTSVGFLSSRKPRKTGCAQLCVTRPFGELDLANKNRIHPTVFSASFRALSPAPIARLVSTGDRRKGQSSRASA